MNEQREDEESYEAFIFCEGHYEIGCKALKEGGKERLKPDSPDSIMKSKLERERKEKSKKRSLKRKRD